MPNKMWVEITLPFLNFNSATVEVKEWISNFMPHYIMDVITWMLVKGAPGRHALLTQTWKWIIATICYGWVKLVHSQILPGQPLIPPCDLAHWNLIWHLCGMAFMCQWQRAGENGYMQFGKVNHLHAIPYIYICFHWYYFNNWYGKKMTKWLKMAYEVL